ncbi:hypothetical protein [Parapedobacter pyrenivorans]|nr:hypothetical protein [Parapedobacter pyrenivorans]
MDKYRQTSQRIAEFANRLNPFETPDRLQQFSLFSANLTNFLPVLDYGCHLPLYRQAYINQQLSLLDERYFGSQLPVAINGWDDDVTERLRSHPGIICTFHAGSYRVINYLLAKNKLPFALLIAHRAFEQQGAKFKRLFRLLGNNHGLRHELQLVDAEQRSTVWQLMRLLKRGYNIVLYLDGFTGLSVADTAKLERLPFLGQHLFLRKGAAYLAQKLGVPLHPIYCTRSAEGAIQFTANPSFIPAMADSGIASEWALSKILDDFAGMLLHAPAQWENWFFLHHQFATQELRGPYILDDGNQAFAGNAPEISEYGIVRNGRRFFLLKKRGYEMYSLPESAMQAILNVWKRQVGS